MKQLSFEQANHLLRKYGVNFTEFELAVTEAHASKIAIKFGFPLVMKVDSPDIIHKTDAGGVVLDINSMTQVHKAYENIMKNVGNAKINGIMIQKQNKGHEVIVGAKRDPQFGPVVIFGMGGIFVEIMKDVSMRIAPINKKEAMEMIQETKAYEILKGARGSKKADVDSLSNLIAKVSNLMVDNSEIKELDLNPCFVDEKGYEVADARIMV